MSVDERQTFCNHDEISIRKYSTQEAKRIKNPVKNETLPYVQKIHQPTPVNFVDKELEKDMRKKEQPSFPKYVGLGEN